MPKDRAATESEVLILGAGFSRAISAALPLTDELGSLALAGLRSTPKLPSEFQGGSFETWLSRIAEDQPHLSEVANRENRALFASVTAELMKVLALRQNDALAADAPPWLYELLSVLHYRRATVISLNYDTLVEAGVVSHRLWDQSAAAEPEPTSWVKPYFAQTGGRVVEPGDVLNNIPSVRPGSAGATWAEMAGSVASTFRLLKLHGSLNWYWVPGDSTGATLNRLRQTAGFGQPQEDDETVRRRELPGRDPFVVPPLATKSAYYQNPITREIWRRAAEALGQASRVDLLGYSLPSADIVMRGMIEDATRGRPVGWQIVNRSPGGPVERLEQMGTDADSIDVLDGDDCVQRFVRAYADGASEDLVQALRRGGQKLALQLGADAPILVAWEHPHGPSPSYRVTDVVCADSGGDVELKLESPPPGGPTVARYGSDGAPSPVHFLTLGELVGGLQGGTRLVARTPEDRELVLVTTLMVATPTGAANSPFVLVPSGCP